MNNIVIGDSIFTNNKILKITWMSTDHTTENQIDKMFIGKRFRRSLEEGLRMKRGADVTSNRHLLIARLKKNWMVTATNRRK